MWKMARTAPTARTNKGPKKGQLGGGKEQSKRGFLPEELYFQQFSRFDNKSKRLIRR